MLGDKPGVAVLGTNTVIVNQEAKRANATAGKSKLSAQRVDKENAVPKTNMTKAILPAGESSDSAKKFKSVDSYDFIHDQVKVEMRKARKLENQKTK